MSGNMHLRGCIFDFDGTIVISEPIHMRAWEDLAAHVQLKLPADFLERGVGMADQQLVRILSREWGRVISESEIMNRKREFYMRRCATECHPVQGVVPVIKSLSSRGIPLAVATSSSREEVMPILSRMGLSDCFIRIWTVEDVSIPKPDPEIYTKAAASLALATHECLAFEDSIAGTVSARSAGCSLVTVQTLYSAEKLGDAILSVKDFTDDRLIDLLSAILA